MNITSQSILTIFILVLVTGCSSLSSLPEIEPGTNPQETDASLGSDPGDGDEQDEEYTLDSNPPSKACLQEDFLMVVTWDHIWTWSPDGTEATGALKGQTKGSQRLAFSPDKNGNFGDDSYTFSYTLSGTIQGDPGQCKVNGEGWVELTASGKCQDGIMELEWIEVGTELQNTTMVCDGKTYDFVIYYPAQVVIGVEVPEDGWAYQTSDSTILPLFRNLSMEWDARLVPAGQTY